MKCDKHACTEIEVKQGLVVVQSYAWRNRTMKTSKPSTSFSIGIGVKGEKLFGVVKFLEMPGFWLKVKMLLGCACFYCCPREFESNQAVNLPWEYGLPLLWLCRERVAFTYGVTNTIWSMTKSRNKLVPLLPSPSNIWLMQCRDFCAFF